MLIALMLVTACSGISSHDRGPTDPDDPSVQAWGIGPDPNGSARLQPDVVVVEGGARSIRGVTDGGLTWRLDPDAGGVDDLEIGKIMFVTGEAIGRVLKLRESADEVLVAIGPVTLVDVIRDGTFQGSDVPIDRAHARPEPDLLLTDAIEPSTRPSGLNGNPGPGGSAARSGGLLAPATYHPRVSGIPAALSTAGRATGFGTGSCCANGAEVSFGYEGGGTRFVGDVRLTMKQLPRGNFFIEIKHGVLRRAELSVSGQLGVHLDFEAGTNTGANQTIDIPVATSFSVPLGSIGPVPLSMKISQAVILKTAFGTKLGEMHATGDYTLASSIGFQYTNGKFAPKNSNNFHRTTSLIQTMGSATVGVMAVLVKHVVHFNLGFNTPLLEAGLYIDVETTIGATAGAGVGAVALLGSGFVQCRGAGLGVYAQVGVGFRLLGVVDVVNKFLSLLDIKPIPSRIGPPPYRAYIYRNIDVDPQGTRLCGEPGGFGGIIQDDGTDQGSTPHASLNGEPDPEPVTPGEDGSGNGHGSGSGNGSGRGDPGDQPAKPPGRPGSGGPHEQL